MSTVPSVCPLDCPDRCSLDVRVEEGRVTAIEGNRVNPTTDGFICSKVRHYADRVYGPDRLRHPMRRTGAKGEGRFERIPWNEAIDTVVGTLERIRREQGGEAILPFCYGGSNGMLSQGMADEHFFRALGSSRLLRTVCAAPTGLACKALYGRMASADFPDVEKARYIILWGANPKHSNLHLMPYLRRARDAGARVALVDPRRTLGKSWIDRHLPVFPGADAPLALAMIGHLERIGRVDRAFLAAHSTGWERLLERAREWTLERAAERTRVEARDIAALAEEYAAADPALVRCGWGLERNLNAESGVAAVLALPAVAGKFGREGGGFALASSPAYLVDDDRLAGLPEAPTRSINMNRLGRALLEETAPPIKALFVYDANPVVTIPDQNRVRRGLSRDDLFTVVFEQVMTDTALYADILLPATTFLEHTELSNSYGGYAVQLSEPVIDPIGEARSNDEVFRLLSARLNKGDGLADGEAALRLALATIGAPLASGERERRGDDGVSALRLERLRQDRILRFDFPGPRPVQFKTVHPTTDDGKVHLWPSELGGDPYLVLDDPAERRYPLALISPATDRTISSSLGELIKSEACLVMHPDDAAPRRLRDGSEVRVHNRLGEVRVRLSLDPSVRPGVVFLPKGIWNRHTRNGAVGTALVPDSVTAASGGACFNDARVEVSPVPG
ncbi:MAG TPA: molybdopterin-dependent oxidoreductase [Candidatus Polarisedimenticolia bacterium]|nr:molybdopterin-dependent oxidoreductase [Candidatus Polarisedimenticolia bacterium]